MTPVYSGLQKPPTALIGTVNKRTPLYPFLERCLPLEGPLGTEKALTALGWNRFGLGAPEIVWGSATSDAEAYGSAEGYGSGLRIDAYAYAKLGAAGVSDIDLDTWTIALALWIGRKASAGTQGIFGSGPSNVGRTLRVVSASSPQTTLRLGLSNAGGTNANYDFANVLDTTDKRFVHVIVCGTRAVTGRGAGLLQAWVNGSYQEWAVDAGLTLYATRTALLGRTHATDGSWNAQNIPSDTDSLCLGAALWQRRIERELVEEHLCSNPWSPFTPLAPVGFACRDAQAGAANAGGVRVSQLTLKGSDLTGVHVGALYREESALTWSAATEAVVAGADVQEAHVQVPLDPDSDTRGLYLPYWVDPVSEQAIPSQNGAHRVGGTVTVIDSDNHGLTDNAGAIDYPAQSLQAAASHHKGYGNSLGEFGLLVSGLRVRRRINLGDKLFFGDWTQSNDPDDGDNFTNPLWYHVEHWGRATSLHHCGAIMAIEDLLPGNHCMAYGMQWDSVKRTIQNGEYAHRKRCNWIWSKIGMIPAGDGLMDTDWWKPVGADGAGNPYDAAYYARYVDGIAAVQFSRTIRHGSTLYVLVDAALFARPPGDAYGNYLLGVGGDVNRPNQTDYGYAPELRAWVRAKVAAHRAVYPNGAVVRLVHNYPDSYNAHTGSFVHDGAYYAWCALVNVPGLYARSEAGDDWADDGWRDKTFDLAGHLHMAMLCRIAEKGNWACGVLPAHGSPTLLNTAASGGWHSDLIRCYTGTGQSLGRKAPDGSDMPAGIVHNYNVSGAMVVSYDSEGDPTFKLARTCVAMNIASGTSPPNGTPSGVERYKGPLVTVGAGGVIDLDDYPALLLSATSRIVQIVGVYAKADLDDEAHVSDWWSELAAGTFTNRLDLSAVSALGGYDAARLLLHKLQWDQTDRKIPTTLAEGAEAYVLFAPHLIPEAEIVYRTVVDSYDVPPDDDDGDSTAAQRKRRWMAAWVSKRKRR